MKFDSFLVQRISFCLYFIALRHAFSLLGGLGTSGSQQGECSVNQSEGELWDELNYCLVHVEPIILEHIQAEISVATTFTISDLTGPGFTVSNYLGNSIEGFHLSPVAYRSTSCLKSIKEKFSFSKCQAETVIEILQASQDHFPTQIGSNNFIEEFKDNLPCLFGKTTDAINCTQTDLQYRTLDGSCNNILHPEWGKSLMPLARLVQPDYADGLDSPRVDRNGSALPSARRVSVGIHTKPNTTTSPIPEHFLTLLHMTFGQILDHDLDRTAISKLADGPDSFVDVMCGEDGCNTTGIENENCFPMEIPPDDLEFTNHTCLLFVRSQNVMDDDCTPGPRQQLNQVTSYLDLSMVYGSTDEEHAGVRDTSNSSRGRLLVVDHPLDEDAKPLLPPGFPHECRGLKPEMNCFTAGDTRVNDQIGLMAMHTIFQRAHNNFEEKLHQLNPHWDGEQLFQEARKLFGAVWQNIVYREYLPPLLGLDNMAKYGLNILNDGYYDGYDPNVRADTSNTFATAAYRLGHSQIQEMFRLSDNDFTVKEDRPFSTIFNRPENMFDPDMPDNDLSGPDAIALGMICHRAEVADRFFSRSIQTNLFSEDPPNAPGTDLAALDVQRGRDHGIPGYNVFRAYCGLHVAANFSDMIDIDSDAQEEFRILYADVDDVDLFPAAMAEAHVPLGIVGPTFACLLGEEFNKIRRADRLWFERSGVTGFSEAQLAEIRNTTLSWLLCENGDDIQTIQKFALMIPYQEAMNAPSISNLADYYDLNQMYFNDDNERRPCSQLPGINFNLWKE